MDTLRQWFGSISPGLIVAAIVAVVAALWTYYTKWAQTVFPRPVMAVIVAVAVFALLLFTANQISVSLSRHRAARLAHNPQVARLQIEAWLKQFYYRVGYPPDEPPYQFGPITLPPLHFRMIVTDPLDRTFWVWWEKGQNHIVVGAHNRVHPEEETKADADTGRPGATLIDDLTISLLQLGVQFVGITHPLRHFSVEKRFVLNQEFTEIDLHDHTFAVLRGMELIKAAVKRGLSQQVQD